MFGADSSPVELNLELGLSRSMVEFWMKAQVPGEQAQASPKAVPEAVSAE
jgi:hypothetical protein